MIKTSTKDELLGVMKTTSQVVLQAILNLPAQEWHVKRLALKSDL